MPSNTEIVQCVRDHIRDPDADKDANPITPRYSDTVLLRKLNLAANEVAMRTLCVKKTDQQNTSTAAQEYALPVDYINIRMITYADNTGSVPRILREVPIDETLTTTLSNSVYGFARTVDGTIRLTGFPSANVVNGLRIDYYGSPTDLAAVGDPALEIPDRYHDAVIYGTAKLMLVLDEEPAKAADMNGLFVTAIDGILDRESEASHAIPGQVRDGYNFIYGFQGRSIGGVI